jgi:hypothetical protein
MFIRNFLLEPLKRRSWSLAIFRWSQLLSEKTNGNYDVIFRFLKNIFSKKAYYPSSSRLSSYDSSKCISNLKLYGYSLLPKNINHVEINELLNFASLTPAYDARGNSTYPLDSDATITSARYIWKTSDLISLDVIKKLAADSGMAVIAQEYLGTKAYLAHITMWLDIYHPETYDAHVYHFDNDGPGFLKFFYYITDIGISNGPHRFIRGSHHPIKPKHFSISKRYDETELLSFYGSQNEIIFEGVAGTTIAEDTRGFHRGTSVKEGKRIILQFEYSLIDIPTEEEFMHTLIKQKNPYLTLEMAPCINKFYII